MMGSVYHIARLGLLATMLVGVLATSVFVASADTSKRGISTARKAVPTKALRLGTPTLGAAETIAAALGKQAGTASAGTQRITVSRDTATNDSRIVSARASSDVFTAVVNLAGDQSRVEIGLYNMLGKKMADVYSGSASRGEHEYTTPVSDLPEGVYVCILQGDNFRRAAKFYLSR